MFRPTEEQLVLLRSMAIDYAHMTMPAKEWRHSTGRMLTTEEFQAKGYMYAAVSLLNRLGALDPEWKKKHGL